jgi:hypothetical protein
MNAHTVENQPSAPVSLEAVELELALGTLSLNDIGFEGSLRKALEGTGGTLLFSLPASFIPDCQRAAAITVGRGEDRQIMMVMLSADGETLRVESGDGDAGALAGLAASYAGVMERMLPAEA